MLKSPSVDKSLEELEDVFNSLWPPKANVKKKVSVKEDGHVKVI